MSAPPLGVRDLIDAHYEALYRYAYRLAGNSADAEDLTQDTFSKAISRLSQLRDRESAKLQCGEAHVIALEAGVNPARFVKATKLDDLFA